MHNRAMSAASTYELWQCRMALFNLDVILHGNRPARGTQRRHPWSTWTCTYTTSLSNMHIINLCGWKRNAQEDDVFTSNKLIPLEGARWSNWGFQPGYCTDHWIEALTTHRWCCARTNTVAEILLLPVPIWMESKRCSQVPSPPYCWSDGSVGGIYVAGSYSSPTDRLKVGIFSFWTYIDWK